MPKPHRQPGTDAPTLLEPLQVTLIAPKAKAWWNRPARQPHYFQFACSVRIYVRDGMNLFDPAASFIGVDGGVDEFMTV